MPKEEITVKLDKSVVEALEIIATKKGISKSVVVGFYVQEKLIERRVDSLKRVNPDAPWSNIPTDGESEDTQWEKDVVSKSSE